MVNRVDVVTGGASAQWGSDAVAGVVNVLLNTNLQGFKCDVSYGESTYGENAESRAPLAWGSDFASGRGHVVVGSEYVKSDGVGSHYRPFDRNLEEQVSYAASRLAEQSSRFFASGVQPLIFTCGGVIIGPNTAAGQALRGIQFGPGGTVVAFPYGNVVGTSAIDFSGGQPGLSVRSGHTLSLPVERQVALFHADFDVSENLTLFAEASWANYRSGPDARAIRDVDHAGRSGRDLVGRPGQTGAGDAAVDVGNDHGAGPEGLDPAQGKRDQPARSGDQPVACRSGSAGEGGRACGCDGSDLFFGLDEAELDIFVGI